MNYEEFVRSRITELRLKKNVSEHKMSLDLDKSGSYIRAITSGKALPSLKELFNIMAYLDVDPVSFFAPLEKKDTPYSKLCARLENCTDEELNKLCLFMDLIEK